MPAEKFHLAEHYDQMWASAIDCIRTGDVEADPVLAKGEPDRRRTFTVLVRPIPELERRILAFLRAVEGIEPHQHLYKPGELHVTVLAPFTATVEHERFFSRSHEYIAAADTAFVKLPAFSLELRGVTISRGAILVQGFPGDSNLNDARDRFRQELRKRGLTEGLDGRYVLQTAHMTVVRFRTLLCDGERLAKLLETYRAERFGEMQVRELELVKNDWYMSRASVECVKVYALGN